MSVRKNRFGNLESGSSMIETVLIMPLLLIVVLNAVNFGYFFLITLNLTAAPRSGIEYGMIGSATPGATVLPPATGPSTKTTTVSYLTYQDMTGAIGSPLAAKVQVCSKILGLNGSGTAQTAKCETCSSSTSCTTTPDNGTPTPASDPEAPTYVLQRVDVTYTFSPLIPPAIFNLAVLASPTCTSTAGNVTCKFHRSVSMRAMD